MNVWETYRARISAQGTDKRGTILKREHRFLNAKMPASLSYHQATINGELRSLAIINSDHADIKTLCTLPGEDLPHGGFVEWLNQHWMIVTKDINNELYTKATMRQCNYLLRWIAYDGSIQERWCIVEDGTKNLTGEYGDNNFIITRGDSRISLTITKDEYTLRFSREDRFLIDDYASPNVLAYRLSKPFKLGGSYDVGGVFCFIMQECNTEDSDNLELHIANYYDHFPPNDDMKPDQSQPEEQPGKKVWF